MRGVRRRCRVGGAVIGWCCARGRCLDPGDVVAVQYRPGEDDPVAARAWRVVWVDGPWALVIALTDAAIPEEWSWARWGTPPDAVIGRSMTAEVLYGVASAVADSLMRHLGVDSEDRKTCFQSQN